MILQERSLNIFGEPLDKTKKLLIKALVSLATGQSSTADFSEAITFILEGLRFENNFTENDPKNDIQVIRKDDFYENAETAIKNLYTFEDITGVSEGEFKLQAYLMFSQIRTYVYEEAVRIMKTNSKNRTEVLAKRVQAGILPAIYAFEVALRDSIKFMFLKFARFKYGQSTEMTVKEKDEMISKISKAIDNEFEQGRGKQPMRKSSLNDFLNHCGFFEGVPYRANLEKQYQ